MRYDTYKAKNLNLFIPPLAGTWNSFVSQWGNFPHNNKKHLDSGSVLSLYHVKATFAHLSFRKIVTLLLTSAPIADDISLRNLHLSQKEYQRSPPNYQCSGVLPRRADVHLILIPRMSILNGWVWHTITVPLLIEITCHGDISDEGFLKYYFCAALMIALHIFSFSNFLF